MVIGRHIDPDLKDQSKYGNPNLTQIRKFRNPDPHPLFPSPPTLRDWQRRETHLHFYLPTTMRLAFERQQDKIRELRRSRV